MAGSMSASPSKRRHTDVMKLMMSDYKVHIPDESHCHDFWVIFHGPSDTPYEGGTWKIHVTLPPEYPFKSPSIGFMNRLYHPNVDEISGSVCLDVINQAWSPMYDLINVFDVFLPQLLRYPNPNDPLNGEAANLLLRDSEKYKSRVRDLILHHASRPIHFSDDEDEEPSTPCFAGTASPPTPLPAMSLSAPTLSSPITEAVRPRGGSRSSVGPIPSFSSSYASTEVDYMGSSLTTLSAHTASPATRPQNRPIYRSSLPVPVPMCTRDSGHNSPAHPPAPPSQDDGTQDMEIESDCGDNDSDVSALSDIDV